VLNYRRNTFLGRDDRENSKDVITERCEGSGFETDCNFIGKGGVTTHRGTMRKCDWVRGELYGVMNQGKKKGKKRLPAE